MIRHKQRECMIGKSKGATVLPAGRKRAWATRFFGHKFAFNLNALSRKGGRGVGKPLIGSGSDIEFEGTFGGSAPAVPNYHHN